MSWWHKPALACVVCCPRWPRMDADTRSPGRGNFLPAYIQTIGIPTFENHTSFFQMAQLVTDKVRTEFIGRGNYKIVPEATRRRCRAGRRGHERDDRADEFLRGAAGIALHDYRDGQHPAAGRSEGRDPLEQPVDLDPRGIRRDEHHLPTIRPGSSIRRPSSRRNRTPLERVTSEFSRSVVSAILEAF